MLWYHNECVLILSLILGWQVLISCLDDNGDGQLALDEICDFIDRGTATFHDGGATIAEQVAQQPVAVEPSVPLHSAPTIVYRLSVKTADSSDNFSMAGASVFVRVCGENSSTSEQCLSIANREEVKVSTEEPFAASNIDRFEFKEPSVGTVESVTVRVVPASGATARWLLEEVRLWCGSESAITIYIIIIIGAALVRQRVGRVSVRRVDRRRCAAAVVGERRTPDDRGACAHCGSTC